MYTQEKWLPQCSDKHFTLKLTLKVSLESAVSERSLSFRWLKQEKVPVLKSSQDPNSRSTDGIFCLLGTNMRTKKNGNLFALISNDHHQQSFSKRNICVSL